MKITPSITSIVSIEKIYAKLPGDWEIHIEHKMFEPAFYSMIIQDWGSNILAAMEPISTYRQSDYRQQTAKLRPAAGGNSSGIV